MTGEKETYSDSARVCRDEAESDGGRFPVMTGGVVRDCEPRVSVLVIQFRTSRRLTPGDKRLS